MLRGRSLYKLSVRPINDRDINAALREREKERGKIWSTQWPEMIRDAREPGSGNLALKLDNGNRRTLLNGGNNVIRVHAPLYLDLLTHLRNRDHRRYNCVPTFARKYRVQASDRSLSLPRWFSSPCAASCRDRENR